VFNDCVKALYDEDIKDKVIHEAYRGLQIGSSEDFLYRTVSQDVINDPISEFALRYKNHGAPQGRVFIWIYNILHPELNPFPEQDWTESLKKVLNDNWRKTYVYNRNLDQNGPSGNYMMDTNAVYRVDNLSHYFKGKGSIEI
jgi:hypothetical protein